MEADTDIAVQAEAALEEAAPESLWLAIEASGLATFIKESPWAYPGLETVHLVGLGLLVGSIFAFDLRVLGVSRDIPLMRLGRHLLPWVWTGFLLNAASGVMLFASDAADFARNPALVAKLGLIALAGVNAIFFQRRVVPRSVNWDLHVEAPLAARVSALLSIVLWLAIVTAGRMIAYVA